MKHLILSLLFVIGAFSTTKAQDVYVCHVVLFCNDNGQCVEIEICDIVESVWMGGINDKFRGSFSFDSGMMQLGGFPKSAMGQSLYINKGTTLRNPKGFKANRLVGRDVEPGKYKISKQGVSLNLREGGK